MIHKKIHENHHVTRVKFYMTKILVQELSGKKYSNAISGSVINDLQTTHGDHHVTRINLI